MAMTYDKRDKEHIKEMKGYYKAVTDEMKNARLAGMYTEGVETLTKYQRAKARKWLRSIGHDPDEEFDFWEYVNEDLLEVRFTGVPPSGGNTRGYGNIPRAHANEYYIWIMFAYGGPSYGLRVLVDPTVPYHHNRYYDHTFVYHDWFVGYEMDALDDIWDDIISYMDGAYSADEINRQMTQYGETVCNGCNLWFATKYDGQVMCDTCSKEYCRECGEYAEDDHVAVDDEIMCRECASHNKVCFNCGTQVERYDVLVTLSDPDGTQVCDTCAEDFGYFQCDNCYEWYHYDDGTKHVVGEVSYCNDCYAQECDDKTENEQ
jgi:hypothetical protein